MGPIIGLADPTNLIITADISEDDVPKLALEQVADLTLDAFASEELTGIITKLPTSLVTTQGIIQDRSIRIRGCLAESGCGNRYARAGYHHRTAQGKCTQSAYRIRKTLRQAHVR